MLETKSFGKVEEKGMVKKGIGEGGGGLSGSNCVILTIGN